MPRLKSGGHDLYRKIRDLAPVPWTNKNEMLFEWSSILHDKDEDDVFPNSQLIKAMKHLFRLEHLPKHRLVHIEKKDQGQTINIVFNNDGNPVRGSAANSRSIQLRLADDLKFVDLFYNGRQRDSLGVYRRSTKGEIRLYVYQKQLVLDQSPIQYLHITLSDDARRRIAEIESELLSARDDESRRDKLLKVDDIKNDTGNFRYSLNLRGLLYIASVIELEGRRRRMANQKVLGVEKINEKSKQDTFEVYSVIKNLSKSAQPVFSALFADYENLDAVIMKKYHGIEPNFTLTTLKSIAIALHGFLQFADTEELELITVKRFLDWFDAWLGPLLRHGYIRKYADDATIKNLAQYKIGLEEYLTQLQRPAPPTGAPA
jgi:hypothetical protein